jgi:hypothetical protein
VNSKRIPPHSPTHLVQISRIIAATVGKRQIGQFIGQWPLEKPPTACKA